jgi:CHAT domain-containing protein
MNQTISLLEGKHIVHGRGMPWMGKKREINDMSKESTLVVPSVVDGRHEQGRGLAGGEVGADERKPEPLLLGGLRDGGRSGEVRKLEVVMKKYVPTIVLLLFFITPFLTPAIADQTVFEEIRILGLQFTELYQQGKYLEAVPIAEKMRFLIEKEFGADHWQAAGAFKGLADLYIRIGRYREAERLCQKALVIYNREFGEGHPEVSSTKELISVIYLYTGRYTEAEPLLKWLLESNEKLYGNDDPHVATSANNLAELYKLMGRHPESEQEFKRSLAIYERKFGENDPQYVANSLKNRALLYREMGQYAEAEPLLKRSLEIKQMKLGENHPFVAESLNDLALLYSDTGRYAEAIALYKRSLKIFEMNLGDDHPYVATSLSNLAAVYRDTRQYAEAETLYIRALAIEQKKLGDDHPGVATTLNNLALLYRDTGRFSEAEPLYKRSLEVRKNKFGKDHLYVAQSLNNLALLYQDMDRDAEAETLYKRSLEICETKPVKCQSDVVSTTLKNLSLYYAAHEEYGLSFRHYYKYISNEEHAKENVFLILGEKQKFFYIAEIKRVMEVFLGLTARTHPKNQKAVADSLNTWLRWKGTVGEFQGRLTETCFRTNDPEIRERCNELTNIRRTLASILYSKLEMMDNDIYRETIIGYEKRKGMLEVELSKLSKDFALEKAVSNADIQSIAGILPKESIYLDFAILRPYDFKKRKSEEKPICFVFILTPGDQPKVELLDLGDAEAIDRHIQEYQKVIQEAVNRKRAPDIDALRQHLKDLYCLIIEPLLPHLQGRKQLFVSPDGSLNLIPFEAFITPQGKYLVEEVSIQYIAAGRDIVRFKDEARAQGKALILADPDYDLGEQKRIEVARQMGVSEVEVRGIPSRDARVLTFKRLPDTRKEAEAIQKTMEQGGVTCRQDKEAIQEVLFATEYPKVLHIATHGYFLPDQKITPKWDPGRDTLPHDALKAYENPMLRSGIALAGANTSQREGKDYGMVNAEKILGLRLKGTELVVLSACETGLGDVQTGEGVFGLKRAFILSGARTVVMSLWSVPSKETTELMGWFYRKWSGGMTKAAALREAKLELMKENPNPFFWGAFVMVGDPGK